MANPITIFRASTGLNIKVDPVRIKFDPETGVTDLAVAYNVDFDQTGRISRRKGYKISSIAVPVHSLFCDRPGGNAFGVIGTSLCLIAPDLSGYRSLATVTADARVSFASVADMTFWLNGFEKGFIRNGVNNAWVKGDYYGPTSKRILVDPPIGTLIAAYNGHIYIAFGSTLYHSDPYSLNAFDLVRGNFPFESQLSMVKPVAGGMFIGTVADVWFLSGTGPTKFQLVKVSKSAAIRGTDVYADISKMAFGTITQGRTGEAVLWTSPDGIFLGTPDGQAYNLTVDKFTPQNATEGAAQIINGRYVVTLAP